MVIPAPLPDPFYGVADLPGQAADLERTGGRFHRNTQAAVKKAVELGEGNVKKTNSVMMFQCLISVQMNQKFAVFRLKHK